MKRFISKKYLTMSGVVLLILLAGGLYGYQWNQLKSTKEKILAESLERSADFEKQKYCSEQKDKIIADNKAYNNSGGKLYLSGVDEVFYSQRTNSCLFIKSTSFSDNNGLNLLYEKSELIDSFTTKILIESTIRGGDINAYIKSGDFKMRVSEYRQ